MEIDYKKNFLIKKLTSIEISIDYSDIDLKKAHKFFLEKIEEEYKKYLNDLIEEETKNNTFKKNNSNNNIFYTPEKLLHWSPLTIIDAPWGLGKTYFIESFARTFNDLANDSIFKKVIIINVLKHWNCKNIPEEILIELIRVLSNNDKKILKKLYLYLIKAFKVSDNYFAKLFSEISSEKKFKENAIKDDFIKEINELDFKAIIFFDNIERLGIYSWEIIKAINNLSEIKNFLFIMPMNLKKLPKNIINSEIDNIESSNDELQIEKYINIPYFELKQNYLGLLKKLGFNDEISIILNDILNQEIDGNLLSIRELENKLKYNNILKNFSINDKYNYLINFVNKIWGNKLYVNNLIGDDIHNFINYLIDLLISFNKLNKFFNDFDLPPNSFNMDKFNKLDNTKSNISIINKKIQELSKCSIEVNEDILNKKNEINENIKKIENINKEIFKCKNKIEKYNSKEIKDYEKIGINDNAIKNYNNDIYQLENLNININDKINNLERELNKKNAYELSLKEFSEKINNEVNLINEKNDHLFKYNKYLYDLFNENFNEEIIQNFISDYLYKKNQEFLFDFFIDQIWQNNN